MLRYLLILVAFQAPHFAMGRIVDRISATVNGEVILASDVEAFRKKLANEGMVDDYLLQLYDRDQILKDAGQRLSYLIDERTLDSEVKRKNQEVTFERVEQEIRELIKARRITRAQLKELLEAKGSSMAEYQSFMKGTLERRELIQREVSSRIKISDDDVAAYYLSKKGPSKTQSYDYTLSHLVFLAKNGGEEKAKERAEAALLKLREGQPFEKIAEQVSEDPGFSQGGALGTFRTGEMSREIEDNVRSLDSGELSRPIKTKFGFQVIKVVKKTLANDPALDEKKEEYRSILFADAFRRQFRSWLAQKREDSFVRINADSKKSGA